MAYGSWGPSMYRSPQNPQTLTEEFYTGRLEGYCEAVSPFSKFSTWWINRNKEIFTDIWILIVKRYFVIKLLFLAKLLARQSGLDVLNLIKEEGTSRKCLGHALNNPDVPNCFFPPIKKSLKYCLGNLKCSINNKSHYLSDYSEKPP